MDDEKPVQERKIRKEENFLTYRGICQWCVFVGVLSVMAWELINLRVMMEELEDKFDNFDVLKQLKEII